MQMTFKQGLGTLQMAVFLVNSCKFNGCGLTFSTLSELIQHIEESHIDSDPQILEQQESRQPTSLALSYVFRVFTDVAQKEKRPRLSSLSPVSSLRSATPTGSEFDDEDKCSSDNDSDDSWTTQEEFTSDLILSMMTNSNKDSNADKPFACPVPGCKKRYKNINGIKYHAKHGHKKEVRVKKPHKCKCGKSYKSSTALQSHTLLHHQGSAPTSLLSVKTKVAAKAKKQASLSISKIKNGLGLVGHLPVATQATTKNICQALKSISSGGFAQAVLTSTGQPATALVTVPVTFSKMPTSNGSDVKVIGAFSQHQPHQQQMLNLIAPSGLVPSGTTITVPIEQITRNLALLQQVKKSGRDDVNSDGTENNSFTSLLSGHQGAPNTMELSTPNCVLSDDIASPFTFSESGYDASHEEEIAEVEISGDRMHDEKTDRQTDLGSILPPDTNKGSFLDLKSSDGIDTPSDTSSDSERKFISSFKGGTGIMASTDMKICI